MCGLSSKKDCRRKGPGAKVVRPFSELPILSISENTRSLSFSLGPKIWTLGLHHNHNKTNASDAFSQHFFSGLIKTISITSEPNGYLEGMRV